MSSEYELILLLLGCASRDRKEQELQGEVDWERLWGVAEEEGLALPLWECLDREFAAYLPEPTAELMSSSATWRTLAQIRQVNELLALLDLFHSRGIEVACYKGPALAFLAYGGASGREWGDLDLLVAPEMYEEAFQLLRAEGFVPELGDLPRCYLKLAYEITLIHNRRRVTVDLHRSAFSEAFRDSFSLSKKTPFAVQMNGYPVETFAPEEHLVLLAIHGGKHGWRKLRWVYDLVALCRSHPLDWQRVGQVAKESGGVRSLSLGLELAKDLFSLKTPEGWKLPKRLEPLTAKARAHMFSERPGLAELHRFQWQLFDDWPARARYALFTLFRPHALDLKWMDLPRWYWPLYYLLRPVRVIQERIRQALKS